MLVEPARAQVEQRRCVELPHGRAVAAFDVVGVDLELRLGIDLGFFRQQQVVVGLVRIGAVGALVDDGLAVPDAAALAVQDAAVLLPRRGRAHAMIDARVVIDVLGVAGEVETVKGHLGAGHGDIDVQVIAHQAAAEIKTG